MIEGVRSSSYNKTAGRGAGATRGISVGRENRAGLREWRVALTTPDLRSGYVTRLVERELVCHVSKLM